MFGPALMVVPISGKGQTLAYAYFPEGTWYDYNTFERMDKVGSSMITAVEDYIPVFMRGGNIILRKDRLRRSTVMMRDDPYTIVIALDSAQSASGSLYVDDGSTFEFMDQVYLQSTLTYDNQVLSYKIKHH
jgi:alpha 1,3-glucosidase